MYRALCINIQHLMSTCICQSNLGLCTEKKSERESHVTQCFWNTIIIVLCQMHLCISFEFTSSWNNLKKIFRLIHKQQQHLLTVHVVCMCQLVCYGIWIHCSRQWELSWTWYYKSHHNAYTSNHRMRPVHHDEKLYCLLNAPKRWNPLNCKKSVE